MAKGFKHGGGGINPLNFRVLAGTAMPANPEEYTVFIETEVPMSRWVFAGVDPGPVDEGMVWIVTGSGSAADFHAIGSGGILLVSPLEARQYAGGTWIGRKAWVWKQGQWVEMPALKEPVLLYDAGDPYPDLTGGWTGEGWSYGAYPISAGEVQQSALEITGGHTGQGGKACAVGTVHPCSFSGVSRLRAELRLQQPGLVTFGICSGRDTSLMAASVTVQTAGEHSLILDTTHVDGAYYVVAVALGSQSAGTGPKAIIHRVWQEE